MIWDIELCALIVRIDPRFQCAASTGTGVAHCESDFRWLCQQLSRLNQDTYPSNK